MFMFTNFLWSSNGKNIPKERKMKEQQQTSASRHRKLSVRGCRNDPQVLSPSALQLDHQHLLIMSLQSKWKKQSTIEALQISCAFLVDQICKVKEGDLDINSNHRTPFLHWTQILARHLQETSSHQKHQKRRCNSSQAADRKRAGDGQQTCRKAPGAHPRSSTDPPGRMIRCFFCISTNCKANAIDS